MALAALDRVTAPNMDKEIIQQIAAEVVAQLPLGDRYWMYTYLVINVAAIALTAGVAAWSGSFLKTKGQNFATKQDFDELLRQLRTSTDAVETIKSEIGQRDWAQREWTSVRRTKLEALLEKMHECAAYLDRRQHMALAGEIEQPERNPISELDALAALYFRELKNEVDRFTLICRKQAILILELGSAIVDVRATFDKSGYQAARDNFKSKSHYPELLAAKNALTTAARSLLERIMNIEEQAPSDAR